MSVKVIIYGDLLKGSANSVDEANKELLNKAAKSAKNIVPVDSGDLQDTIMWKADGETGGHDGGNTIQSEPSKGSGVIGSAADHAVYVEFGTRNTDAQPYLRPAIESEINGSKGQNTMKKESNKAMKQSLSKGVKTYEF